MVTAICPFSPVVMLSDSRERREGETVLHWLMRIEFPDSLHTCSLADAISLLRTIATADLNEEGFFDALEPLHEAFTILEYRDLLRPIFREPDLLELAQRSRFADAWEDRPQSKECKEHKEEPASL